MLAVSPLLKRYSKAMEYDYSSALRAELIADATRHFGGELRITGNPGKDTTMTLHLPLDAQEAAHG